MGVIHRAAVYFYKETKPLWYAWSIRVATYDPTYTWIAANDIGCTWQRGGSYFAILPTPFSKHDNSEIEDLMIVDNDVM